jgi:cytochrome c2
LRRYLPTLIILLILLGAGGYAIYTNFVNPPLTERAYVPTFSSDAQTGQFQALILVGGIAGVLVAVLAIGGGLAFAFLQLTKMQARLQPPAAPSAGAKAEARPAPAARGGGSELPQVPLSSNRSLLIFWTLLLIGTVIFLIVNYGGKPASPVFGLSDLANMKVFKLPGEHIEGLPPFIAGPGDDVTALHLFIGALGFALAGTAAAGVALARGWAVLDQQVKTADQAPRTVVDEMLARAEQTLADLRAPKAPRPVSAVERVLVGLDVLLLLVVAGVVAAWVVPTYLNSVAAVDSAVEATAIAASWTPTPPKVAGPSAADLIKQEVAALPAGDAAAGEATFTSAGCAACHSLQPDLTIVGPSQAGVGARAASRIPGYTAEMYIYESIVNPNAHVVEGFQPGLMPATFKDTLKPEDIANLIAFLLTLK